MGGISRVIKAVAFDLDGTLYPNYRLYRRLLPRLMLHPRFYNAFSAVRQQLHSADTETETASSFYDKQADLMAAFLKEDKKKTKQKLERLVYRDWETLFPGIELFPHVKETLSAFRDAGLKLALLSDFPPERKITLLGLEGFFDFILSTEETGALKPSGIPFAALIRSLELLPEEILYAGNSPRFDVKGAKAAGMKAALIKRSFFSTGHVRYAGGADFVFRDYRQLREYVLE
ncbi:MAG: HAD family hydrolase [Treponema sp.]|nr:HAD family hydrolase [Treponema sp.]